VALKLSLAAANHKSITCLLSVIAALQSLINEPPAMIFSTVLF
jgi:hypothetical protein